MAIRQGIYTGYNTAVSTYNARNHVAEIEYNFTAYDARLARYWHNRRYADNTIYHSVNSYADTYKFKESLYKGIRGLRNPIGRLVEIEAAKVLGGSIDYEAFETGAIMLHDADDSLKDAIRNIFLWSNMDQLKSLYVREGATMGDIALKVVDDVERGKVRLEVLDPRKVYDIQFDEVGNVKFIDIRYDKMNEETGKWYEYREVIDKERFELFDGNDTTDEWDNPYGFVPVQWVEHMATGLGFGVTSWHKTRHKIDNLNDLATLIHDNVRKVVNTKYGLSGAELPKTSAGAPGTITVTDDNRDKSPIVELGKDGVLSPIAFPLDIEGALSALISQHKEVENDLPQLALQNMRDSGMEISGVSAKILYGDALDIIDGLQGTYLGGLKQAIQMAISVGAFRRYDGFKGYNLDSYHSGALDFNIKPRELYADTLTKRERLELTKSALESTAPELMLSKLDYDEDEIEDALSVSQTESELKALAIKKTLGVPESQLLLEMGYKESELLRFRREKQREQAMAVRTFSNSNQSSQNGANNDATPEQVEDDNGELVA